MGDIIATLSNIIMIRQRFFTLIIAVPLNVILVLSSFYILTRINLYLAFLLLSLIIIFLLIIIYSNEKYLSFSKN